MRRWPDCFAPWGELREMMSTFREPSHIWGRNPAIYLKIAARLPFRLISCWPANWQQTTHDKVLHWPKSFMWVEKARCVSEHGRSSDRITRCGRIIEAEDQRETLKELHLPPTESLQISYAHNTDPLSNRSHLPLWQIWVGSKCSLGSHSGY